MKAGSLISAVEIARALNNNRLAEFPDSPFFLFSDRELTKIEDRVRADEQITRKFYDDLNIGLMCARELETIDPEYCDTIYQMLEEVRIATDN